MLRGVSALFVTSGSFLSVILLNDVQSMIENFREHVVFLGLMLTVLPEAFRYGAGPAQQALFGNVLLDPETLRQLMFGLALILVMLYRPAGLWPDIRHRREMGRR